MTGQGIGMQKVKLQTLLQGQKEAIFVRKLTKGKGNPKGVWKALKTLSGTRKPRVHIEEVITENGVASDEASIANERNKYFINILEQIGQDKDADVEFNNNKLTNFASSRLNDDTPKEIIDIIVNNF